MTRRILTAALLLAIAVTLGAPARAAEHPQGLMSLLRAYDRVPTAEAVRRAAPEPVAALHAVAADDEAGSYVRRRATSLLSLFPGEAAAARLEALVAVGLPERVRWVAAYTLVRSGAGHDRAGALAFAGRTLERPEAFLREAVVRALRHVEGAEVVALVERVARAEEHPRVLAAVRRFRAARR